MKKRCVLRALALLTVPFLTTTASAQQTWQGAAVVAKHSIILSGNSAYSDSYDSTDATKSTAGRYDSSKYSGNQGNLVTMGGFNDAVNLGTADIYGTLHTGPGCPVSLMSAGGIGPHGSQVNDVTTAVNLGYILQDANFTFADTSLPADYPTYLPPTSGNIVTWSNNIVITPTNSTVPPANTPWGGVLTNNYPTWTTTYPGPLSGLSTNTVLTNVTAYPGPIAGLTTNAPTAVTNTVFPAAGTYLGSISTNKFNGTRYYTYYPITGYSYLLTEYGVPHYTYSYSLYQTNTAYFTNSYNYVLNSNTKYLASSLSGKTCVTGPNVVLVLPNGLTGAENFTFNPGANLLVYSGGTSATLNGNQYLNPNPVPSSFILYCASSVTSLVLNGNGLFSGVLVAPNANMTIASGGANNEDFCGTLTVNSLQTQGHVSFHYDEALNHMIGRPPQITQQPISQTALPGSSVTLEAGLNVGSPLFSLQWRFNGIALPGATNLTLALPNVQSNTLGSYDLVIQSPFGSVTSQVATVTLTLAPDYLWVRNGSNVLGSGPYGGSWARALAHDAWGDLLLAGGFSTSSLDLGGATLTNTAGNNFLCQYDSSGLLYWAKQAGSLSASGLPWPRVGTDAAGNVYWAAHFTGVANLGPLQLTNTGVADLFLAKFSRWGTLLWARQISAYNPQDYTPTFGFATDAAGNIFLAGSYAGAASFGTLTLTNTGGYLAKYDPTGNLLWATDAPPAQALALSPSGSLYLALSGGTGTLAKYDAQGNALWSKPFPRATALAVDARENLYATGNGAGTYDGLTLTNVNGLPDFFVARCDASGTLQWLRQIGSTQQQRGLSLGLDRCGGVFVSSASGNARTDPTLAFGSFSLTNVEAFVAEYDTAGNALWAKPLVTPLSAAIWGLDAVAPGVVGVAGSYRSALTLGNFSLSEDPNSLGSYFVAKLTGLTPPQLTAPMASADATFQLTVGGAAGFRGVLEGSANLQDWFPLTTNTLPFTFTDSDAASYPSRYYRVSYLP